MIYYIGDMHLGHKNVIKHDGRPFDSVDEMDAALISNWNRVVKDEDEVYIIGDFIYRSGYTGEYYLKQLKGHKHLIVGNHDSKLLKDVKACSYFESVEWLGYVKDGDRDVVMCHFPIAEWSGKRRRVSSYHVFSHIHNRQDDSYEYMKSLKNALNAGCMLNDFKPVTLDELIENKEKY